MDSAALHPAALSDAQLLADCDLERLRRSGPGGQRRNKVQTGVRLKHRPTGLVGEATERRSAAQNHAAALLRLRFLLAVNSRGPTRDEPSELWQRRIRRGRVTVNAEHADAPALLAEALDVLARSPADHRAAAAALDISATQFIKLLSLAPAALQQLNAARQQAGLTPLRG